MGEAIGRFTEACDAILLGRTTYEMFEPAWSTRTVDDDPGAPFFNDTPQIRRVVDPGNRNLEQLDHRRSLRPRGDSSAQGRDQGHLT